MSTYTSVNGLFSYSITNNTTYTVTSSDLDILQDAFNRWDNIIQIDNTKYGNNHVITINVSFNAMAPGVLGGASNISITIYNNRTWGNFVASSGDITLNVNMISSLINNIHPSGKTRLYYVVLHEIGHILGIGPFWFEPGAPITEYIEDGVTKSYYTGTNALREYKNIFNKSGRFNFVGIPIEDDGSAGTAGVHAEEGQNHYSNNDRYINGVFHPGLQHELMSGWLDSNDVDAPLSRISLGFLEDLGYIVNYNLADVYIMSWLATNDANNLEQTYILGFLDVSGGNMINRNGNLSVLDGTMDIAGDVSFNSKLSVGGDVSLCSTNGARVDICGNLHAVYPNDSIPTSAIKDLGNVTPNFTGNVDFQQGITIATKAAIGSTTLPSATGTALHVTGDIDFSGNLLQNGTAFVSGATDLSGLSNVIAHGTSFFNSLLMVPRKEFLPDTANLNGAQLNTGIGHAVFADLTSGSNNTAVGYHTLTNCTTGQSNVAIGGSSLDALTDGANNTAVGSNALGNNISGSDNVSIGKGNQSNATANKNTSVGVFCLDFNTTGEKNVAMGYSTGRTNLIGSNNTYLGAGADASNGLTDLSGSTAIGYGATITANNQIVLGTATESVSIPGLKLDVSGDINFTGNLLNNGAAFVSGATNLDGLSDAKVGGTNFTDSILLGNVPSGTIADASSNVGVGANVFTDLTSGKSNVGIGSSALKSLTTGSENIAIGADAGINLLDGTKNISIGHDAGPTGANSAIERTVAIGQSARPEKNDQIVLGGVFSNNYPEVLHPGQTVARDHVVVNPQSVTANVAPIQATGEYLEFTVPIGYIGSTDFKYFCSVASHNMIKNFTIAAYDTTKTDKTYYVKTTGTNDPYFLFSETSGGTALNDASTELTLYKGRTYRFIRDETGAGHPFNIGTAINVNAFNMKVISTGSGSPTTSNTYSNPYPLSVNGFVNIENNLRVTGSIQGSIRQW